MLEFFGLLLKLFYLSIAMIIYALFNLFVSAGAYYKKKGHARKRLYFR